MNTVYTVTAHTEGRNKATITLKVVNERNEKVENIELSLSKQQIDSIHDLMFDMSRSMREGENPRTFNRNIA